MNKLDNEIKNKVCFPVIKVPHHIDIAEYKGDPGISVLRTDTNEIISNMSSNYQLVLHNEALSTVEASLESNKVEYKLVGAYLYGTRNTSMRARYILPSKEFKKVGGELYPMIDVNNSYDGLSRFHCAYGIWKKICSNGAMGLDGTKYDRIHIRENISIDGLFHNLDEWLNTKLPELVNAVDYMSKVKPISFEYYEKFLRPEELIQLFTSNLHETNYQQMGETAWAQMNVLTEFAQTLENTNRRLFIEERAMRFIYEHVN